MGTYGEYIVSQHDVSYPYRRIIIAPASFNGKLLLIDSQSSTGGDANPNTYWYLRESIDGGRSFSSGSIITQGDGSTWGPTNPTWIIGTGKIFLFYSKYYSDTRCELWSMESLDGATFSNDHEISTGKLYNISLNTGIMKQDGTLILPLEFSDNAGGLSGCLRSTDNGNSWSLGGYVSYGQSLYEPSIVEQSNGQLLMVSHSFYGTGPGGVYSTSSDNGVTWTIPAINPNVLIPESPVNLLRISFQPNILVCTYNNYYTFSNVSARQDLMIAISRDDGYSWSNMRYIKRGAANIANCYPVLSYLGNDTLGIVYWNYNAASPTWMDGCFVYVDLNWIKYINTSRTTRI